MKKRRQKCRFSRNNHLNYVPVLDFPFTTQLKIMNKNHRCILNELIIYLCLYKMLILLLMRRHRFKLMNNISSLFDVVCKDLYDVNQ